MNSIEMELAFSAHPSTPATSSPARTRSSARLPGWSPPGCGDHCAECDCRASW
ncbi:hypothetical protein [Nocardia sp. NRRL S-836]|uniref:hypothetical protein n=1 Tax=Nocardia sp. NRRL S-836 TaxID=1519492 RepID=UPI0012F9A68A|nr:hypothetical protein [Nocardia sp. NRRL S-836]